MKSRELEHEVMLEALFRANESAIRSTSELETMHVTIFHRFLFRYLIIFLALAGMLLGGYTRVQSRENFNLISPQQELRLGNRLARDIERQVNLVTDPVSEAYINQLGRRIARQTKYGNAPWQFHIIQDREINAFNIPGAHVYVYTGLIDQTSTESELAGVMAHEIAHGVERHATEALTAYYGLRVLGSLVLGENPAAYQRLLARIVGAGYLAKHSRDAEREADRLAVHYLYQAGFDPNGMVTFYQKLLEQENRKSGLLNKFFSTHPLTQERIRNIQYEISRLPPRPYLTDDSRQFHAFKNNLFRGRAQYGERGRVPPGYRY